MQKPERIRPRALGIAFGRYETGPLNAITDVEGLLVGHATLVEGARTRTGATAILPHGDNLYQNKVPAGIKVLNGYGKFAGSTQIAELGEIETPILLTNTLAVGRAIEAINGWTLEQPGNEQVTSINAVVGETNDSRLNDIRASRPGVSEMIGTIKIARSGAVEEGAVGAGTGTVAFGLKGGIGTASRRLVIAGETYTLGVLVQSNFGGSLRIDGRPHDNSAVADKDGSIVMVLATDAPLQSRNLSRLAERCFGGLARTGAALSNGSGDYALAFSTHPAVRRTPERRSGVSEAPALANENLSSLFEAAIDASEEAIINALAMATPMEGFDTASARPSFYDALRLPAEGN